MSALVIVVSVAAAVVGERLLDPDVRRAMRRRRRARARLRAMSERPGPTVPVEVKEARSAVAHARALVVRARQLALASSGNDWHDRDLRRLAEAESNLYRRLEHLRGLEGDAG